MGPLGPWVGRIHVLLRCTEPNMCLSLSLFVTRGREGTFSIVMYGTLHGYICKPNITKPKTREALSVGLKGKSFLLFSEVGTYEFEFMEAIPKKLDVTCRVCIADLQGWQFLEI